jgi:ABC-type transport system involved in cytochrome c biogenesis ATPase subunit
MRQIRTFAIEGLFQRSIVHKIEFSQNSPVTILSGPNGVGKTHILRLIYAILGGDTFTILEIPYHRVEMDFSDGKKLIVTRIKNEDDPRISLTFEGYGPRGGKLGHISIHDDDPRVMIEPEERFRRHSEGIWIDTLTGELLSSAELRRYLSDRPRSRHRAAQTTFRRRYRDRVFGGEPWLQEILESRPPIFIDTKRLDTPKPKSGPEAPQPSSRIDEYIEQVRLQVAEARRASLAVSQEADKDFAARVLRPSKKTVREEELKKRYEEIAEQNAELYRSGLSNTEVNVEFPSGGVDATERRVLSVFIDDWRRKLEPLLPVNDKLQILQRIVNEKFVGKRLRLNNAGSLVFVADGEIIPVSVLSSGEQHILALFTMLLFSANAGSVVLIDEPEISLHAAWKHAFVDDITEVASIADLQIVLATHSSGIINGRWDLVQELGTHK